MSTGGLLCPRWAVTYKRGKSNGRQGCFGRIGPDEIQPTVVGRAEPHNLRLVHNTQDRVVTIRENARCQARPLFAPLLPFLGKQTSQALGQLLGWLGIATKLS